MRLGVRTRLRAGGRRLLEVPHWLTLRRLGKCRSGEYRDYLAIQLRRTLSKRDTDPGIGAVTLINRVADERRDGGRVLCVGCRNALELDRFRARGFDDVVGFDVVYASHALEHSYDVNRVVREIVRVARDRAVIAAEVPVRVQASAADRVVFSG